MSTVGVAAVTIAIIPNGGMSIGIGMGSPPCEHIPHGVCVNGTGVIVIFVGTSVVAAVGLTVGVAAVVLNFA